MGRREQAKEERRVRIVAAAHDLVRQGGVDAVSMRQVAGLADVSISTVYNLFESRDDVLAHVFNDAFERYLAAVRERASSEPIQRILDAVDIAAEFYAADAPFYRSSVWLVEADSSYKLALQRPRFGFFRELLRGAISGGVLRPDADAHVLVLFIVPMFSAPYQAWAGGWVGIDEFRARAKLGMSIVLRQFAADAYEDRLGTLLSKFEQEVQGYRRRADTTPDLATATVAR